MVVTQPGWRARTEPKNGPIQRRSEPGVEAVGNEAEALSTVGKSTKMRLREEEGEKKMKGMTEG